MSSRPVAVSAPPAPAGRMFRSLRIRNYRLYAGGQLVSMSGTWMNRVAQDWLVLELTDNSPVALGIATTLQFAPTLLLSLWAGLLGDRYDKRALLLIVQCGMALCALALGLLDVTGAVQLWQVYAICLAFGILSTVDNPVRHAFATELVGADNVTNALALNSLTLHVSRVTGPATAGVLIGLWGTGWVFLLNVVTYAGVIVALVAVREGELFRPPRVPRAGGQIRAAVRHVAGRPELLFPLGLMAMVSTFGFNLEISLAVVTKVVLGRDAASYGLLTAGLAAGSVIGALLVARRRGAPRRRYLLLVAGAFGLVQILVGGAPTYELMLALLVPAGVLMLMMMNGVNSTLQLTVDPTMRGRVMGLYSIAFLGGRPIGSPLMGWIADQFGGRAPLVVGGAVCVAAAIGWAAWLRGKVAS